MRRLALVLLLVLFAGEARAQKVTVGSKAFPESWILGDLLAQQARGAGAAPVEHRSNLGGTEIVWQALRSGGDRRLPRVHGQRSPR
jgi:osmoprotectant transport system permease protein